MTVGSETVPHGDKVDPNFQYGTSQTYVALVVLVVCFLVTSLSMVLTQRYRHLQMHSVPAPTTTANGNNVHVNGNGRRRRSGDEAERHLLDLTESEESDCVPVRPANYRAVEEHTGEAERHSPIAIEDLLQLGEDEVDEEEGKEEETACCEGEREVMRQERRRELRQQSSTNSSNGGALRRRYRCNTEHREYCTSLLSSYAVPPAREAADEHVTRLAGEYSEEEDDLQVVSHVFLLLFLATSMFIGKGSFTLQYMTLSFIDRDS